MAEVSMLRRLYRTTRSQLRTLATSYPKNVQCNVCGWEGRTFASDSWHPRTICRRCGAQVRHRLVRAAIEMLPEVQAGVLVHGKRVLHFAPEKGLSRIFYEKAAKYVTADLCGDDVDLAVDLCRMSSIADQSFDLVIACDVLEHVGDDSAALREIHRVLAPNGWAVLTAPQKDGLATKHEDPSITTPEARLKTFGQEDHVRIYGDDLGAFIGQHGFKVLTVDEHSFPAEVAKRNVLAPPVLSRHPLATNRRRAYFAHKK